MKITLKSKPNRIMYGGTTYASKHAAEESMRTLLEDGALSQAQDPFVDYVQNVWVISIANPKR
jgi:hypothetical protein